jgi:glycosyltransferase A (GT-A) superfamily protein (DUF2064 family)
VLIIGSDCYQLSADIILQAYDQLERQDAVIGPATDGGYYLLGLKGNVPSLFRDMAWSTAEVCRETLQRIEAARLTCGLLPRLQDIDTLEDLRQSGLEW